MRKIFIIGIGAGDPDHVTVQAVKALNRVDVFFVVDKGEERADLAELRRDICRRHIAGNAYRMVDIPDPERDRTPVDYGRAVRDWHDVRAMAYAAAIETSLADDQTGAFLAWGEPTLYDSTIRILETVVSRGLPLDIEILPGISSLQVLVARHKIAMNTIGGPIRITTGRRLEDAAEAGIDNVFVMLDGRMAFRRFTDPAIRIYWGAYLGSPDEILVSGPVADCADEIAARRAEARARKGWIMDTYLLRRAP